jgi:tetratricopeptide (TPR) repeat protein
VLKQAAAAPMQLAHPWSTASLVVLGGLTSAYPDEPALHLMYGNLLASRKRTEDAVAEWTKALDRGLAHTIVYRNLGATAAHEGRKQEALEYYRKAWKLAGKDLNLFTEFDRFLATQGLHEERLRLYGQLPVDARDRSMVALRRVPQLLDTENYDEALEELSVRTFLAGEGQERISRIYFHEALLGKGVELMNAGRWGEASEILKQGLTYPRNLNAGRQSVSPGESMINYMLGLAAEAAGRPEEAKEYWLKAACEPHSDGELTQAYEMLAWLALDNRPRAMHLAHKFERFGRGEESPPSWFFWHNPRSVLAIGHALGQLAKGRPHEAQGMFKKVVADEPDGRFTRPHANMSLDILQRISRKVTGPAKAASGGTRNRLKAAAPDPKAGNGDGQPAGKRPVRRKSKAK